MIGRIFVKSHEDFFFASDFVSNTSHGMPFTLRSRQILLLRVTNSVAFANGDPMILAKGLARGAAWAWESS